MLDKSPRTMQESSKAQIIRQLSSKRIWKRTRWTSPSLNIMKVKGIPRQIWLMSSCRWMTMMKEMSAQVKLRGPWLKMNCRMVFGMSKLMAPMREKRKPKWGSSRVYQATIYFNHPSTHKKTHDLPKHTSTLRIWLKESNQLMEPRVTSWPTSRTIYRAS